VTATWCGLALLTFVLGVQLGKYERADRRITREAPTTITPSLRGMRSERR
jgi:hypothetical protein